MSGPQVSFLVTAYNKAEVLGETLQSLRAQQVGAGGVEIVVAEDGSTDGTPALLAAEAARDPRLRVVGGGGNLGPAIRVNQAARAARGRWLCPVDGDDLLAPGVTAWMLARLAEHDAPLIYGRSRRSLDVSPPDGPSRRIDAPLAFAAAKPLVRMGFVAEASLWRAAGGADEAVFIQDQSLPLRLARHAPAMVWTEATVYWLRPAGGGSLSRARAQQSHDRFLSALHVAQDAPGHPAQRALAALMLSALWKLRRGQGGAAALSADFLRYGLNRATGLAPGPAWFAARARALAQLPDIRRPAAPEATP